MLGVEGVGGTCWEDDSISDGDSERGTEDANAAASDVEDVEKPVTLLSLSVGTDMALGRGMDGTGGTSS